MSIVSVIRALNSGCVSVTGVERLCGVSGESILPRKVIEVAVPVRILCRVFSPFGWAGVV